MPGQVWLHGVAAHIRPRCQFRVVTEFWALVLAASSPLKHTLEFKAAWGLRGDSGSEELERLISRLRKLPLRSDS